jgi:hypothetical protein
MRPSTGLSTRTSVRVGTSAKAFAGYVAAAESAGTPKKTGGTSPEGSASRTCRPQSTAKTGSGNGRATPSSERDTRAPWRPWPSANPCTPSSPCSATGGAARAAERMLGGMKGLLCRTIPFDNGEGVCRTSKKSPKGSVPRCTSSSGTVHGKVGAMRTHIRLCLSQVRSLP